MGLRRPHSSFPNPTGNIAQSKEVTQDLIDNQYTSNPDPRKYSILRIETVNSWTIVWAKYQGCTNYEGAKILVFSTYDNLWLDIEKNGMDPHFFNKPWSPIARFRPSQFGWELACRMCGKNTSKSYE